MYNSQSKIAFQKPEISNMILRCLPVERYKRAQGLSIVRFPGCNVENASYGLTVCAERTAIQRAVVEGHRQFRAIAVTCDIKDRFVGPCGACRQVLLEFGSDWTIYLTKPDGSYKETSLNELLPLAFSPSHLAKN